MNYVCGLADAMCWMDRGLWHFDRKLNSEASEKHTREAILEIHLCERKDRGFPQIYSTRSLTLYVTIVARGSNNSLKEACTFIDILVKNTKVVDESIYIVF
jgi:hypothetical protein